MALQGEARKLYHREYMRRRRAWLPTRGVVVMEQRCSECVLPPSPERIVTSLGSGYRLCESCYEAARASREAGPVSGCGSGVGFHSGGLPWQTCSHPHGTGSAARPPTRTKRMIGSAS